VRRVELVEGLKCSRDCRMGSIVSPHGVQRDSRQAMLPWLLLAVRRRSTRIPRTRGAAASCSGSADTSGLQLNVRLYVCFARAFFSWMDVSSGRPLEIRLSW